MPLPAETSDQRFPSPAEIAPEDLEGRLDPTGPSAEFFIAEYQSALALARAVKRLRERGYPDVEGYTGHPWAKMRNTLRDRRTPILAGFLAGGAALGLAILRRSAEPPPPQHSVQVLALEIALVAVAFIAAFLLARKVLGRPDIDILHDIDRIHGVHAKRHWLRLSCRLPLTARSRQLRAVERTRPMRIVTLVNASK